MATSTVGAPPPSSLVPHTHDCKSSSDLPVFGRGRVRPDRSDLGSCQIRGAARQCIAVLEETPGILPEDALLLPARTLPLTSRGMHLATQHCRPKHNT
ncbi:hypothetical protein OsI_25624 [Oryza sativa Indica Group]|uniref:Uncharacterized protein n=1 Tax=Oryza sativa subsp. indica TaxID=39946 RepID=B8B518_ORYSI|nr:hypothetical protein OsI_25624 [Oryza sativa Indica Group]